MLGGQARPASVGREELAHLLLRALARGSPPARCLPTSLSSPRSPAGSWSCLPCPVSARISTVHGPIPGIARRRRQAPSCPGSARSTRPAATSRAAISSVMARDSERSSERSSAGGAPARAAAEGRSLSPAAERSAPGQRRPRAATTLRWMSAARSYSISCSQIANASASNGSGLRVTRSHGRRRSERPISSSPANSRRNGLRSSSTPSAKRIRSMPCSAAGAL